MEVDWSLLRCMGYKELMSQCGVDCKSLLLTTVNKSDSSYTTSGLDQSSCPDNTVHP